VQAVAVGAAEDAHRVDDPGLGDAPTMDPGGPSVDGGECLVDVAKVVAGEGVEAVGRRARVGEVPGSPTTFPRRSFACCRGWDTYPSFPGFPRSWTTWSLRQTEPINRPRAEPPETCHEGGQDEDLSIRARGEGHLAIGRSSVAMPNERQ
jgi:hypothetical protein